MRRTPFEEATLGTSKFQQVLDHAKNMEEQAKQRLAKRQATVAQKAEAAEPKAKSKGKEA